MCIQSYTCIGQKEHNIIAWAEAFDIGFTYLGIDEDEYGLFLHLINDEGDIFCVDKDQFRLNN